MKKKIIKDHDIISYQLKNTTFAFKNALYRHKLHCKDFLHRILSVKFPDPSCIYCSGIDTEEHSI